MNLADAIDALRPFTLKVPHDALDLIRTNWPEAEPILLKEIETKLEETTKESRDALFLYSIYLCAEMRSRDAFPLYLRLCRLHDPVLQHVLGDILTDAMQDMLSRSCYDRIGEIKELIEDNSLDEFARCSALDSLENLALDGEIPLEELAEYCIYLMREGIERKPSNLWNAIVCTAADIHADKALPFIEKAYERGLADPQSQALEEILDVFKKPADEVLEKTRKWHIEFTSTEKKMHFFVCQWDENEKHYLEYNEDNDELLKILNLVPGYGIFSSGKKIGRNSPCPCGSGKKYKRCCINESPKVPGDLPEQIPPEFSVRGNPIREGHRIASNWMRAGYLYKEKRHFERAFLCWRKCWEELKPFLPETLDDPNDSEKLGIFEGYDFLSNWISDFGFLLSELALDNVFAAEFSIEFFQEILARFPKMEESNLSCIRADLAVSTAILGHGKEAVSFLENVMVEKPGDAQSCVMLAEMHGTLADKYGLPLDLERAIAYLEKASERAQNCDDLDVIARIAVLRLLKAEMEKPLI